MCVDHPTQAQQRRLTELETENENLRVQLHDAQAGRRELEAAVTDLRQELDNNAGVLVVAEFSIHLLPKHILLLHSGVQDALQ